MMLNRNQNIVFAFAMLNLILVLFASVADAKTGLLYPDLREPYRSIFTNIIEGVEDTSREDVLTLEIKKDDTAEKVREWIRENNLDAVIALGSRSNKLLTQVDVRKKIVGAITKPNKKNGYEAGILLSPDPKLMVNELNRLVPSVKHIYMVYSEGSSSWYLDVVKHYTKNSEIELHAFKSDSIKQSLLFYSKILQKADNRSAIWLLQDRLSSDSRLIMPMLLEKAWDKKIPVISNKAGHVERGVLLALFPDHFELGVSLARLLTEGREEKNKYLPYTSAYIAANKRTADHLGLDWSRKLMRSFKLVFPEK
jgi:putative ABC transport system substrate-binding protein